MPKFRVPIQRAIHDVETAFLDVEADDVADALKKVGTQMEDPEFEVPSEAIKTYVGETDGWEIGDDEVREIKEKTDDQQAPG